MPTKDGEDEGAYTHDTVHCSYPFLPLKKSYPFFFLFKLVLVTWYDNARSLWWPFELNCLLGATLCVSYLINLHLVSYLINLHLSLVKVTFSDTYNT